MRQDFQLDSWIVQPALHQISDGEAKHKRLSHKAMGVLLCLAEHAGDVVTKEELFERVWDGAFTSDEALSTVVYELRKALEDNARTPRYVETIRKSGYRLIAPVTPLAPATEPAEASRHGRFASSQALAATLTGATLAASLLLSSGWFSPGATASGPATAQEAPEEAPPTIRSLAVRPLESFTDECSQDFFADGLTEMLIADLAYLGPLDVIPITEPPNMTSDLDVGADAILDGSVLQTGDRLWISIQLVDKVDGHILWGGTFERSIGESLDLQLELAREISYQIVSNVTTEHGPWTEDIDPQVSEAIQMGSHFLRQATPADAAKAREYFSLAIRLDPDHAPAHVGLADSLVAATEELPPESHAETYQQARDAAETALEIDANLPEAHIALASIYFQHDWQWSDAEDHFRRGLASSACSLEDSRRYAAYLSAMGRHDEAVTVIERGLECAPTSKVGYLALAWTHYLARGYDEALAALDKARELDPDFAPLFRLQSDVLFATGRDEQALEACRKLLELTVDDDAVAQLEEIYRQSGIEGVLRCLISLTLDETPDGSGQQVNLARFAARLGEVEGALAWLERAFEQRHDDLVWLRVDPAFDNLRTDARFDELLGELGFDA